MLNLAGQGTATHAVAKIFWDRPERKWTVYVRNLPPAPADKIYQLWFMPKSGLPVDAQRFNTNADGSAEIEIDLPPNAVDLEVTSVTAEPASGVERPTGALVLSGQ